MARYPNWRQVAENGVPAGDYSHARICSGGASSSAPSDLAGAQPVRSVTARLKSNDSVDDLRTPVVARPFCYPPRLSGSGISISFSAASVMNFQMAGDPRLRKICVLRVVGAIVHDNILEIEGTQT